MSKNRRLCLAASAGGHMSQLLKLSSCWEGQDVFWVTTAEVLRSKLGKIGKVYVVGECNRQHLLKVLLVSIRCIRIILKERPDIVISTGAAVGCIMCFLGKITGAKVVWVDSITNVNKLSLSGRLVWHIADLFLAQWQQLAKQYKNIEYVGKII
jgi:UDP-N-acetylglucosamine:LPS N-acetylglucosamine transferase